MSKITESLSELQSFIEKVELWQETYVNTIEPLMPDDTVNEEDFVEYDEAYASHLETLHKLVEDFVDSSNDH